MSAWMCSPKHLSVIVNTDRATHIAAEVGLPGDPEKLFKALHRENQKSLDARYGESKVSQWFGKPYPKFIHDPAEKPADAVDALKLLQSYDYQTCEHDEYGESKVRAFVLALQAELRARLMVPPGKVPTGYDDARWSA